MPSEILVFFLKLKFILYWTMRVIGMHVKCKPETNLRFLINDLFDYKLGITNVTEFFFTTKWSNVKRVAVK